MMITPKNNEDKLIRDLFNDFNPEEVPVSVKQNVMNRVLHDWVEKPQTYQPLINKKNRWWIIAVASIVITVAFLADASIIHQYLNDIGINSKSLDLGSIHKSFKQLFLAFSKIPSLVYFIIMGIVFLLGLDKILNRLANL